MLIYIHARFSPSCLKFSDWESWNEKERERERGRKAFIFIQSSLDIFVDMDRQLGIYFFEVTFLSLLPLSPLTLSEKLKLNGEIPMRVLKYCVYAVHMHSV